MKLKVLLSVTSMDNWRHLVADVLNCTTVNHLCYVT